jgi:hypothetical protein
MEEAASQGWSNDELVRQAANQLEGEAEAMHKWACTGLRAGVPLTWATLQQQLTHVYSHKKLDYYYTYKQLAKVQQEKLESVTIYQS